MANGLKANLRFKAAVELTECLEVLARDLVENASDFDHLIGRMALNTVFQKQGENQYEIEKPHSHLICFNKIAV